MHLMGLVLNVVSFSLIFTLFFLYIALKLCIYDQPGDLKIHKKPIPYLGGIAVFLAVLLSALINHIYASQLFLFSSPFLILGLYDDIKSVSSRTRFIIESILSFILILFGLRLPINIAISVILTYLFIVGAVNAVNWMDGMDGLLTGISVIVSLGYYFLAKQIGHPWIPNFCLIFISALLGFLAFNFRPAKIFLGDAGSYFIGFTFAYIGITLLKFDFSWKLFASVLSVIGVFIVDSTIAVLRRIRLGRHPFHGDRSHIYDQIYKRTGKYVLTVLLMYVMAALGVGLGILVFSTSSPWYLIIWLTGVIFVYGFFIKLKFLSIGLGIK